MTSRLRSPPDERIAELADGLLVDATVELDDTDRGSPEAEPLAPVVPIGAASATGDARVGEEPSESWVESTPDDERSEGGEGAGGETESESGGVDPRIRARRIAIRRAAGRRRLRRLLVVVGAGVACLLAWVVTRTPLLDVDRVAVVGATRTPPEAIVDAARVPPREAMTDVDLAAVERRVDDLPWVAAVDATRHWPGTVVVRVEERQPVAVAPAEEGGWAVLSADGRVMEVVAEPPAGLVTLADVDGVTEAGGALPPATLDALAVARLLPSALLTRVAAVVPTGGGEQSGEREAAPVEIELRLQPVGVVRLGSLDQLADKILAAAAVLGETSEWCVAELDVEVPATPVLTRRPECA